MKLILLFAAVVLIAGCVGTTQKETDVASGTTAQGYSGKILAGTTAPLIDFDKADYDVALKSGNVVFLYFYATWCPICRAEVPELYAAFNELKTDHIIGFRVNFNDGDTDADERALAQQFQVPYQHTKVIIKDGKATKFPDSWNKERYLSEINKALG